MQREFFHCLLVQLDCSSHVSAYHTGSLVMASGSVKGNGGREARALNVLGSSEIHLLELFDGPEVKRGKPKMINQANPSSKYYFHLHLKMSQNNTFLFLSNFSVFFNVILEGLGVFFK